MISAYLHFYLIMVGDGHVTPWRCAFIISVKLSLLCSLHVFDILMYCTTHAEGTRVWANCRQSSHHLRLFPPQVWLLVDKSTQTEQVIWTVCTMIANFAICFLGWWRCFANNYLHWAAGTTWLLLIAQGNSTPPSLSLPFCSIIFVSQSIRSWRMSFFGWGTW